MTLHTEGIGYPDLDDLINNPCDLEFIIGKYNKLNKTLILDIELQTNKLIKVCKFCYGATIAIVYFVEFFRDG